MAEAAPMGRLRYSFHTWWLSYKQYRPFPERMQVNLPKKRQDLTFLQQE